MNDQTPPVASKADLKLFRQAIRNGWPIPAERWEETAGQVVAIVRDPQCGDRHKLAALLTVVDAATLGSFDVAGTLKRLLGDADVPEREQTTDPLHELRQRGDALLARWSDQANEPGYLAGWAKALAKAITKGELQRLYDDYNRRGRDRKLAKRDRLENRKRASALRKMLVK